jgi:hypothetical protein
MVEGGGEGGVQEVKRRAALLGAGGRHRPDPLAPSPAGFTPCALRHVTVDHDKANGLLGQVVGRRQRRVSGSAAAPATVRLAAVFLDPLVALPNLRFQFSNPSLVPLLAGRFHRRLRDGLYGYGSDESIPRTEKKPVRD